MSDKYSYLDHNATTYLDKKVLEAMLPYYTEKYANPSSIYSISQEVRDGIDTARAQVMKLLGASSGKLIFTGGGSESDNMAIKGVAYANVHKGKHIITSTVEHHAVLHTCEYLVKQGYTITYVPVDGRGLLKIDELKKAIRPDTILISIMYANNETGVIQPVAEIGKIAREHKIYFHTDAVQAVGKIQINVEKDNIDLLTLSAHKFYGPKGIGALYMRKGVVIDPLIHGGGQELNLRAGTENAAGIIGLAKALELANAAMEQESVREAKMRDRLEKGLIAAIPEGFVNGTGAPRLPNTLNLIFKYIEGESMLLFLDQKGIAASSGSACTSGSLDPSHVLLAMGVPHEFAHGSLRFSFGQRNTEEDVDKVLQVLPPIVERLRSMSPLWGGK